MLLCPKKDFLYHFTNFGSEDIILLTAFTRKNAVYIYTSLKLKCAWKCMTKSILFNIFLRKRELLITRMVYITF